ncbi:hypothetical protein ACTFIV_000867 [Dictyostelium citrinum]
MMNQILVVKSEFTNGNISVINFNDFFNEKSSTIDFSNNGLIGKIPTSSFIKSMDINIDQDLKNYNASSPNSFSFTTFMVGINDYNFLLNGPMDLQVLIKKTIRIISIEDLGNTIN